MTSTPTTAPARLSAIAALSDNYIWCIAHEGRAVLVDPGDVTAARQALARHQLTLTAILLTHHHADHVAAVLPLVEETGAVVYGPAHEKLPHCDHRLVEGDTVLLYNLPVALRVLDVPGHTAGHIAYTGEIGLQAPVLFCGDTLFSAGCGRLFEGSPVEMLSSLDKLSNLPQDTLVCCAHEYTLSNLRWALAVEPGNPILERHWQQCQVLREHGQPTLPSSIGLEQHINPFLRVRQASIAHAAAAWAGNHLANDVETFAALREWKNQFK